MNVKIVLELRLLNITWRYEAATTCVHALFDGINI